MRLESIELVNKILEEAHKRIQPTGTGIAFFFKLIMTGCIVIMLMWILPWIFVCTLKTLFYCCNSGELFDVLKSRLNDSNKNVVMATLATVGGIASAMGPAVEKASKVDTRSLLS